MLRADRRRTGLRALVILLAGTATAADGADDAPGLDDGHRAMLGRISPARAAGTAAQNGEPFAACSPSSFVGFRKLAAATAFLREVSGLKNPAPSPRMMSTVRPASSTIEAVITVPSCLALAKAAFATRSAMSSVSSIIIWSPLNPLALRLDINPVIRESSGTK